MDGKGPIRPKPRAPTEGPLYVGDLLELVGENMRHNGRKGPKQPYYQSRHLEQLFAGLDVRLIGYLEIEEYKARRLAQGAAPKTVNNELGYLGRGFRLAYRAGLIERVPSFDRIPCADRPRTGFLEPEDLETVVGQLSWPLDEITRFAYATGWRRGEIVSLRWKDVDWKRGVVDLRAERSKNGEGRIFPIHGAVKDILERCQAAREWERYYTSGRSEWVFHRHGEPVRSFWMSWRIAVAVAGFPDLRFHDLRRSFARNAARAGVEQSVAMRLTGHKTPSMYRRYRIVDERDLVEAASSIEAYRRASAPPASESAS